MRTRCLALACLAALLLTGCAGATAHGPGAQRSATSAAAGLAAAGATPAAVASGGDAGSAAARQPQPGGSPSITAAGQPNGAPGGQLPGATKPGTRPPVVTNGQRALPRVALTFDADMTDAMERNLDTGKVDSYANTKVIDILESGHIPATFFLTGEWVERYPDVTRRLAADPRFELGNHTYRHSAFTAHCYSLPSIAPADMAADVAKTFSIIKAYGGRQTRYFRFPGGCYNDAALQALAPFGLTVIQWDVVSGDPFATAAKPIIDAVLSKVQPGSIVVMHITKANAQYTDAALPVILSGLAAKGLRPVTLSELLGAPA